jgi:hypothetical protein
MQNMKGRFSTPAMSVEKVIFGRKVFECIPDLILRLRNKNKLKLLKVSEFYSCMYIYIILMNVCIPNFIPELKKAELPVGQEISSDTTEREPSQDIPGR